MYFAGASAGAIRTRLVFEDELHFDLEEYAVTAFGGYATPGGWSVRVALGAILDGELDGDGMPVTHDLGPGLVAAVGGSRRWTPGGGAWFVTGSASLSVAVSSSRAPGSDSTRFVATDLRVGAIGGRTFATRWSPYLLARAFGGPVLWSIAGEDVTGTDTTHVQLGAGLSVALPWSLTAMIDVSALGEQAVSLGISKQL